MLCSRKQGRRERLHLRRSNPHAHCGHGHSYCCLAGGGAGQTWKDWTLPLYNYQLPLFYRKMMKPSSVLRLFIALVYDDSRARMYDEVQDEIIPC